MAFDIFSASMLMAVGIAGGAGVIRGITGFGGALVMTPPLALIFGPKIAVPIVLLLETFAAAPMLPEAMRAARWSVIAPISLAACATVPIGGYVLLTTDPQLLRRAIAGMVVLFSLLLLIGMRYKGPHRLGVSITLGGVSGALLGATSIGGPPVILYLLSGPDSIRITRANLTLYVVISSAAGLVMLWSRGILDSSCALTALVLAPFFFAGVMVGSRLFSRFSEQRFRRFTLLLMMGVSTVVLLA